MDRFAFPMYTVRRKVLKLLGGAFHVFDPTGQVVFYSQQKAFTLKEDIRLFTGEDMSEEVLWIQARKALDISATYDVIDSQTGSKVGALRRKGMKSLLRDEWHVLDTSDQQVGTIQEDSMALALLRRFLTGLVPQKYTVTMGVTPIAQFKQHFNPFVMKVDLDFSQDASRMLDRRLGIAAGILLCAIEGKQGGG